MHGSLSYQRKLSSPSGGAQGMIHATKATPNERDIYGESLGVSRRRSAVGQPAASMALQFSRRSYRLAWVLIVTAHVGIVFAYDHEAFINSYILLGSRSEMAVQLLGLGASIRHEIGVTLVVTNRILMAWHIYGAVQVVLSSLWYRSFVFRFRSKSQQIPRHQQAHSTVSTEQGFLLFTKKQFRRILAFYRSTGARGRHFDAAFDVRETVEIVSQTIQAYSITCLITNNSVLHFVSIVLVLNCWSTPLIRLVFSTEEAKKRILCLAIDAFFDFCCALAIPFLTFGLWGHQVATLDFYDAVWLIRSSTLLQYNLVNTWAGVLTTRLPALGLILALETLKTLLHPHSQRLPNADAIVAASSQECIHKAHKPTGPTRPTLGPLVTAVPTKQAKSRVSKFVDLAFFIYGMVILVLYTKAMAEPTIDQSPSSNCLLQLRPWGRRKAQCAVLDIDCKRLQILGSAREIAREIKVFDASVIASLTIASCPALEMPSEIQLLKRLLHLEIYNSTLSAWGSEAALTRESHPVLTGIFLVKVFNIKNGLPKGLLSPHFPPSLCVVQIAGGDLEALVADAEEEELIRTRWPNKMFVFTAEHTPLRVFPSALLAKTFTQTLSFSATNISLVPPQAFFGTVASAVVYLNNNPISNLPSTPSGDGSSGSTLVVHLRNTQIQEVPAWFAAVYTTNPPSQRFFAHGSPLCSENSASRPNFVECKTDARSTQFPLAGFEARRAARE